MSTNKELQVCLKDRKDFMDRLGRIERGEDPNYITAKDAGKLVDIKTKHLKEKVSSLDEELKGVKNTLESVEEELATRDKQLAGQKGEVTKAKGEITELKSKILKLKLENKKLSETKPKNPSREGMKEGYRTAMSMAVGTLVAGIYAKYPFAENIIPQTEFTLQLIGVLTAIFTRVLDKTLHEIGKLRGNEQLMKGVFRK